MRKFTSAHAKNHFGELIDAARAAPEAITKYDRTVDVMVAAGEFEQVQAVGVPKAARSAKRKAKSK